MSRPVSEMVFSVGWFQLWLRQWQVDTQWKLAVTCCSLVVMAVLTEGLRVGRCVNTGWGRDRKRE